MLADTAQAHGFDGAVYMHISHPPQGEPAAASRAQPLRIAATHGFDTALYVRCNYLSFDPLAARACDSYAPFAWKLSELDHAHLDRRRWLGGMASWGARMGVLAPVQDYTLGPAFLNVFVSRADGATSGGGDHARLLTAAAAVHMAALRSMTSAVTCASTTCLSPREIAVLRLAAVGRTEQETATTLELSRRGVQFHLASAMEKLKAPNKTAAVALALSGGLIRL